MLTTVKAQFESDKLERFTAIVDVLLSLLKLGGLLGVPIGLYLVLSYAHRLDSPLPVLDAGSITTLLIVVAVYGVLISVLFLIITMPILNGLRPSEIQGPVNVLFSLRRTSKWGFCKRYLLMHAAPLSVIPLLLVEFVTLNLLHVVQNSPWLLVATLLILFCVCPGISLIAIRWVTGGVLQRTLRTRQWRVQLQQRIWAESTASCVIMFVWVVTMTRAIGIITQTEPTISILWIESGLFATLLVAYLPLTLAGEWLGVTGTCAAVALFALGLLVVNPSYFGQMALRFIGTGGGIPITIDLKSGRPAVPGCLVIELGSQVTIVKMDHPTPKLCSISFMNPSDNLGHNVITYPLSEVLSLRVAATEQNDNVDPPRKSPAR